MDKEKLDVAFQPCSRLSSPRPRKTAGQKTLPRSGCAKMTSAATLKTSRNYNCKDSILVQVDNFSYSRSYSSPPYPISRRNDNPNSSTKIIHTEPLWAARNARGLLERCLPSRDARRQITRDGRGTEKADGYLPNGRRCGSIESEEAP